jgi:O-antigen/teichoic acid export membrane protein
MVYAVSGAGFAGANLVLARVLPTVEFAIFSLAISLINVFAPLAPAGTDGLVNRREISPDWVLLRRALVTSAVVGVGAAGVARLGYGLTPAVAVLLASIVVTAGLGLLAGACFQSMLQLRISLPLAHSFNLVILVAAAATWIVGIYEVWLPLAVIAVGSTIIAVVGWAALRKERHRYADSTDRFEWAESLSFAGLSTGGLLLGQLDRLLIPQLLPLRDLAVFSLLVAIVGAPFRILQRGTGYTLIPRLRRTTDVAVRRRLLRHEGFAVACMVVAASVAVWVATPLLVRHVVGGKYDISGALILATLVSGLAKVVDSFARSVVSALGSRRELTTLNALGWGSVVAAAGGALLGARWGLVGVVYGVAFGWWARALVAWWLAIPHLHGPQSAVEAPVEAPAIADPTIP